jgi:DNA-binding NtrC family response regulator
MHILLIEDAHSLSLLYRDYLSDLGGTLHYAANAEEGLQIMQRQKIDLLFLDLHLPGLDGLGLLKKMRSDGTPLPLTIVITANDQIKTAVDAITLGARDYIIKPFTRERILEVAQKTMQHATMANDIDALRAEWRKPLL